VDHPFGRVLSASAYDASDLRRNGNNCTRPSPKAERAEEPLWNVQNQWPNHFSTWKAAMRQPRNASSVGSDVPYDLPTVCFIEVSNTGEVTFGNDIAAYERALRGESRLYAVWPGKYSSDLFLIDDLDEYARGRGIVNDPQRTGIADHIHDAMPLRLV